MSEAQTLTDVNLSALEDRREPTDAERASVAAIATRQLELKAAVVAATRVLQEAIGRYWYTARVELPEAMRAIGMSDFRLLDGTRVRIDDQYVGTKLTDPEGLAYVDANGGSSAIKTLLTIEMDRGDVESARELVRELRQHRFANRFKTLVLEEYVHQSTSGPLAREFTERGLKPPLDKLGVTHLVHAVVGDKRPPTVELRGFKE